IANTARTATTVLEGIRPVRREAGDEGPPAVHEPGRDVPGRAGVPPGVLAGYRVRGAGVPGVLLRGRPRPPAAGARLPPPAGGGREHRVTKSPYRWAVVGMLWLVCVFNYADRQAIFSVFPRLKAEMDLSDVQLGVVGGAFMWVY